jgi:nucleotide-binding universal stress UspA family protein
LQVRECESVEKANLIVSGARGLSDLKGLLVGSVSHKLSHLSPVTCITVK